MALLICYVESNHSHLLRAVQLGPGCDRARTASFLRTQLLDLAGAFWLVGKAVGGGLRLRHAVRLRLRHALHECWSLTGFKARNLARVESRHVEALGAQGRMVRLQGLRAVGVALGGVRGRSGLAERRVRLGGGQARARALLRREAQPGLGRVDRAPEGRLGARLAPLPACQPIATAQMYVCAAGDERLLALSRTPVQAPRTKCTKACVDCLNKSHLFIPAATAANLPCQRAHFFLVRE